MQLAERLDDSYSGRYMDVVKALACIARPNRSCNGQLILACTAQSHLLLMSVENLNATRCNQRP
jgi:hypothetical protein